MHHPSKHVRLLAFSLIAMAAGAAFTQAMAQSTPCPVKIGGVLPLTGSMGAVGKNIASSAQLAIKHINDGTPTGTTVGTGPEEFKKALELVKKGTPIKYVGASGPIEFDAYGDVGGAPVAWHIDGTALVVGKPIPLEEVQKIFKEIDG